MNDPATRLTGLPSIDDVLRSRAGKLAAERLGRQRATELARKAVAGLRESVLEGRAGAAGKEAMLEKAEEMLAESAAKVSARALRRVINATGVIIHTNLGRAPLSEAAARAAAEAAAGYCNLEYDLPTGRRGPRGGRAEELAAEVTGSEAAVVVNNCAAAAYLMLTALTAGREVIISRGELVEIGGDFRIPEVLERSGAVMREVGTTNRTKIADYERAITSETAAILRVHPSNYRVVGFTAMPTLNELSTLARERGILLLDDAGSGAMALDGEMPSDEPVIGRSLSDGADVVTFSGDKLLGGPQCGIAVGRADLIAKLRKHPLYRVLRADKMVYAALEATLGAYARGNEREEIPVQRMMATSVENIRERAAMLAERIRVAGARAEVIDGDSVIGGGSVPGSRLATALIAFEAEGHTAEDVERILRRGETPVIGRIEDGRYLLDLRTVALDEEEALVRAIKSAIERLSTAP